MADVAASVLARLKKIAKESGRSYQLCLQLFCQEEFLRRFGVGSMEELPVIDPEQLDEFKMEVEEELQMNDEELQAVLEAAASAESGTEKSPEEKAGETAKEKPGEKAEGQTGGQAKEP